MSLVVVNWGGNIYDAQSGGTPIEEWSCSLSLLAGANPNVVAILAESLTLITNFHTHADTRISDSVGLNYIKVNEVDVSTGHQITNPTNEVLYLLPSRGGYSGSSLMPTTTATKVTIDDGTRAATSRGGFFVPRTCFNLTLGGRVPNAQLAPFATQVQNLLQGFNDLVAPSVEVGVWSRKNHAVTASSRVRVGDVPDNISRRKDDLREAYTVTALTP